MREAKISIADMAGNSAELDDSHYELLEKMANPKFLFLLGKDLRLFPIVARGAFRKALGKKPAVVKEERERAFGMVMERHFSIGKFGQGMCVRVDCEGKTYRFAASKRNLRMVLHVAFDIFRRNSYALNESLIKGKVVVDAGANVGVFSAFAISLGAKKIYAFEPAGGTYRALVENIRENGLEGKVIPIRKALGEELGKASLVSGSEWDWAAHIGEKTGPEETTEEVEVARLDDELGKEGVGLLKVDVEGLEKEVLRGGAGILERSRPVVVFEYHRKEDSEAIPKMLKGYECTPVLGKETIMLCRPRPGARSPKS